MSANSDFGPFSAVSLYSLLGVVAIAATAYLAQRALLPKHASAKDRGIFVWLVFDGLTHFIYEGSFLYLSTLSDAGTVNGSSGPFAEMWKEYAKADARWGFSDPTVVSLEILTVLGAGPLCFYIAYQMVRNDLNRHFWIVVLSTAEIYGGWMTFCPEWLTGNKYLRSDNFLHFWVYLMLMNLIWVFVPVWLMVDSYRAIAEGLRQTRPVAERRKGKQA